MNHFLTCIYMSAMWISGHVYNLGEFDEQFDEQYKSHTVV